MWHEARRSERKVHDLMDAARKRAQRRAVFLAKRRGDPQQSIQVVGSRSRTYRDDGLYQATLDQQGLKKLSDPSMSSSLSSNLKYVASLLFGIYILSNGDLTFIFFHRIPWNGKQNILIDRFDGRALLDFIRDSDSRHFRAQQKTEEEEELEEFVNFERYRDLIKHRRRGCRFTSLVLLVTVTDEEGLQHVNEEMEAKTVAPFTSDRSQLPQPPASKGSYSQVGFSYDGDGKEETHFSDGDNDDDDEDDEDDEDFTAMIAMMKEWIQ
ncbi:hypothetical protein CK203_001788 [Vitis vinifera]|uniref:Suppressor of white apricot N-terminal domain-containing protein n=1 Tax=Vitis vinifera TaxID=29760 RepID=A0A438KJZ6_VITVI|nr:hypothetical protein CK203_001788 [Vitis vinifera]